MLFRSRAYINSDLKIFYKRLFFYKFFELISTIKILPLNWQLNFESSIDYLYQRITIGERVFVLDKILDNCFNKLYSMKLVSKVLTFKQLFPQFYSNIYLTFD